MDLPSKTLERAVEALGSLPGVGKRTALRYALHLLQQDEAEVRSLSEALLRLKTDLHRCHYCHNVSDSEVCPICSNPKRWQGVVCVVEDVQAVMALENTQQYHGLYHVLGGVISPIDGVGVHDLEIQSLVERVEKSEPCAITEVVLALPTTMEGDTTSFYISRLLRPTGVQLTTLARGVAIGDSLEYADEITLGRSIAGRIPFDSAQ